MREVEVKLHVPDPQLLRQRLHAAGAREDTQVLEVNRILDTPGRTLLSHDCGLRIRTSESLSGGRTRATLTYKGPREPSDLKEREELEVPIGHADTTEHLFNRLGYATVIVYEKRRTTYMLGGCEIALDELPQIGWWVEIEGPAGPLVARVANQIGLDAGAAERRTYVEMAADAGVDDGTGRRVLAFAPV